MRIPDFQSRQPTSNSPEHAVSAASRRGVGDSLGVSRGYRADDNSTLPPGEAVHAVDTVDFSVLSLSILEDRSGGAPVSGAAVAYSLDQYVVNPEKLAQVLVRASLAERQIGRTSAHTPE